MCGGKLAELHLFHFINQARNAISQDSLGKIFEQVEMITPRDDSKPHHTYFLRAFFLCENLLQPLVTTTWCKMFPKSYVAVIKKYGKEEAFATTFSRTCERRHIIY